MKSILKSSLLLFCVCLLAGCTFMEQVYLYEDVNRAKRHFQNGDYDLAAVNYQSLLRDYPESPTRQKLMLNLAHSYYNRKMHPSLTDAYLAYEDYLKEHPNGTGLYRDEAEQGMKDIRIALANRDRKIQAAIGQIELNVEQLRATLEDDPYNARLWLKLGDELWKLERFNEAAQAYAKAQEINAALQQYDRVRIGDSGAAVAVTPRDQARRERNRKPLLITDINEYKSRLDSQFLGGNEQFYVVTGLVHNQSSRRLNNVVVQMLYLNAVNEILDVTDYFIGDMPPGAVRGFKVEGSADDIYNIWNVKYQAFER